MESEVKKKNWFVKHKFITVFLVIIIVFVIIVASSGNNNSGSSSNSTNTNNNNQNTSATTQATPEAPATRQVKGTATTLSTGDFTGGKDVVVGLYDVTTTSGQSGNFIVSGSDSYDEILGVSDGQGVPNVRVQISNGDQIKISGLTSVTFTPVSTPFITTHTPVTLYAGTFTVGQDIGAGRYVATTTTGSSGNFIVSGIDSVDEILGQSDGQGVPSVTTNLTDGDVISISGLSQVIMTPK
ncbi:MAG: hypothetical protein ABSE17_02445 [Candidatus Levyibacteriota bacterium]